MMLNNTFLAVLIPIALVIFIFFDVGNLVYRFLTWLKENPNEKNDIIIYDNESLYSSALDKLKQSSLSSTVLSTETGSRIDYIIYRDEEGSIVLEIKNKRVQKRVFSSLYKLDEYLQLNTSARIQDFK